MPRIVPLLALAAALFGCRSAGHADIAPYDSAWLGVYTIEAWTYNDGRCDAEGPSILGERPERGAIVQACTISEATLNVAPCVDETSCKSCDGSIFSVDPPGWPFLKGDDVDGWASKRWRLPDLVDGHCEATLRDISVKQDGDALVVRAKYWQTGDYGPPNAEGRCEIDDAARAAVDASPCAGYEVVRLRLQHPDCDPLDTAACADDRLCQPYGNRFLCLPSDGARARVGEDCHTRDCAPGLICVDASAVPGCAAEGCCTEFCDITAEDRDGQCSQKDGGSLCAGYYEPGWEQPGRDALGVCYVVHRCDDGLELPGEYVCDGDEDCDDGTDETRCP